MAGFLGNFQGTYSAEKVIVTIGGVSVHGFTDGDFITAKYDEDRYKKEKGIDGEITRIRTVCNAGSIEFTLMDSSKAIDELNQFNPAYGNVAPAPISIADLSGRTLLDASKCWLKTAPDIVKGKEIGESKWVFDCAYMEITYGGANNNSVVDFIRGLF